MNNNILIEQPHSCDIIRQGATPTHLLKNGEIPPPKHVHFVPEKSAQISTRQPGSNTSSSNKGLIYFPLALLWMHSEKFQPPPKGILSFLWYRKLSIFLFLTKFSTKTKTSICGAIVSHNYFIVREILIQQTIKHSLKIFHPKGWDHHRNKRLHAHPGRFQNPLPSIYFRYSLN